MVQGWLSSVRSLFHPPPDMIVQVPTQVLASLEWLIDPFKACGRVVFASPSNDFDFDSVVEPTWTADSRFGQDLALHINVRELRAIRLACHTFFPHTTGRNLIVLMDNTVAMFYVNRQGGARSTLLCQETMLF